MKRRKWKPEQKALIVLEGLKGRPIGELCAEHEISQAQYYQWRDLFLANAARAFEPAGAPSRQGRLERENARLKALVGERALELKKKRGDPRMRRGPYAKVAARNSAPLERIRALKAEHPFWGYRRIWAHLRYVDGLAANQKRVYGIMKANDLQVRPNPKLRAQRKPGTSKPRPTRPNEWWGIDMTKGMIEGFGWVYLVVVLDGYSKKVVGHYAGLQARAGHWLVALNRAVNRQFPHGIEGQSLNLMADNGCRPTSLAFMRAGATLGIRQAFTSYSNPKGNADTERFLRTLKEELVWLREWTSPAAFVQALERWLADDNASCLHSALGYRAPNVVKPSISATPLP